YDTYADRLAENTRYVSRMSPGKQIAESLHTCQHQRRTVLAATLIATQVNVLPDVFTLTMQPFQFSNQLCSIHKAEIHPLPRQRVNGMCGVAHQRQTVRGKLARITPSQREHQAFTLNLA